MSGRCSRGPGVVRTRAQRSTEGRLVNWAIQCDLHTYAPTLQVGDTSLAWVWHHLGPTRERRPLATPVPAKLSMRRACHR